MKAKEFIPAEKPRNFVAKNAKMGGAGQHKDKKKAEKQGDVKHKNKEYATENVDINNTLSNIEKAIYRQKLQGEEASDKLREYLLDVALNAIGRDKRKFYEPHVMNVNNWDDAREFLNTVFRDASEQGVAEGLHPMVAADLEKLATLRPTDRYSAYANIRDYFKADPALFNLASDLKDGYHEADMLRGKYKTDAANAKYKELEPMHQAFIKQALGQEQGVAEGVAEGKSGAKYKIKSIGYEGGKDYYISPNTGKKVYKKAKVGDHETPSGEYKPEVRMPYKENVADEGVFSFLKAEPASKKKWDPAKDSRAASNYKNNDDSWVKLLIDKHRRGIPLTDREWNSIEQWKLKRAMSGESTEIQELSTDKLAQYKKAAGADAKKADADGDYARGDKRFKGINRATNKQFDNDLKKHGQKDVAERVRDPEDWDEGNTEPANNFAVYINGKKWKVFKGRGRYADDNREQAHYQQLKDWAAKKSADTGKKWTVSITGEAPTE